MTNDELEPGSRIPRRLLFAASGAAAVAGISALAPTAAEAAPASTSWKLGGNADVAGDGSNFLGPTTSVPLIFKSRPSAAGALAESMRLTPAGLLGLGTKTPGAKLDVQTGKDIAARGTTTSGSGGSAGVTGVAGAGTGVRGTSTDGAGVAGTSTNSYGLQGNGGFAGMRGDGASYGTITYGTGSGSTGVFASGDGYGLYALGSYYGVYGSGASYGVFGSGATGIYGSGSVGGVTGTTANVNGNAVLGTGGQYGVKGEAGRTAGVRGDSNYVGVWAQAPAYALYAECTGTTGQNYGVFAKASAAGSFAVFAQGNAHVNGTLSKVAGSFKIDHPLDPNNRWLSHSFVESPDMMNVYNGNVTLDASGSAVVKLPDYFTALNRDFRYQLTTVGGYAPVYISAKVAKNAFSIGGGTPGLEVSWQVTGIRQDDYAKENPIVVDSPKSAAEAGTRQYVSSTARARLNDPSPAAPGDPELNTLDAPAPQKPDLNRR